MNDPAGTFLAGLGGLVGLAVVAAVLGGCAGPSQVSEPDRFETVYVDGVKCITWLPYDGGAVGSLQCDFNGR